MGFFVGIGLIGSILERRLLLLGNRKGGGAVLTVEVMLGDYCI